MSILERDNWLDKTINFMISDIVEYDMRRAGLSIIKEEKLLEESVIKKLESMEKKTADKRIGVLQKTDSRLKEGLKNGFRKYRLMFGEANGLKDEDILSVKKDAIFVKRYCQCTHFCEHIEFVEKHTYEAYLYLNNMEFYWKSDKTLDVKGISDNRIELHRDYMLDFIWNFMKYLVTYDADGAKKYLIRFIDKYKRNELPIEYYRELNQQSQYTYMMYDNPISAEYLDPSYLPSVVMN